MSTRSSPSPAPLRVELYPSRRLQGLLVALAVFIQLAILQAAVPLSLRLALSAALSLHLLHLLRVAARCRGCLSWRGEYWLWAGGGASAGRFLRLRQATAWPGLIVLRFREWPRGAEEVFVLLPDSAAPDAQRRLRIALRHMPVFGRLPEGA